MDTRVLRTFTALARTGSFTAAAAELHLAQSTVTVQIRALEKDLRVRLFDRLPTGAVLTETGARLLERAHHVLDAEDRLRYEAHSAAPVAGSVTIGASESLCAYRLPLAVAALSRGLPTVGIHMRAVVTPAEAAEQLRAGRIDFALLLESDIDVPHLEAEVIGHEPLALVAASGHPLAPAGAAQERLTSRERLTSQEQLASQEQLSGQDFFLLEEGCSYSDAFARHLLAMPGKPPRMTRFGSIEAVRACVEAGLGLALLPVVSVAADLASGRLRTVESFPGVPVQMLRHRSRWPTPATQTVMARLRRLAADDWPDGRFRGGAQD
ncbi:LysR family transcriptional regulator [Streptomyces sp. CB02923]|uniref:LysR family transcriptional regulator n=1 Tax=Streptomyces sp. CB02923 TaxID=1718985 RepID=UPI00093DFA4F|nr:LysR family transcriptional regulator [Streptomyces sp. CB02923]OKI02488.1 LysR family transcriptional regulator [Streptomyces sp. CB02923]